MLIGGMPKDVPQNLFDRSPVNFAEQINVPTLVRTARTAASKSHTDLVRRCLYVQILHGALDEVAPPDRAERIVDNIRGREGKVKHVVFEGEGHGWKNSETVKQAIEEEIAWYEEILGLGPPKWHSRRAGKFSNKG